MSDNINMQRVKQNISALQSLRSQSPDPALLQHYTGWGGLREAVYTPAIFKELKACVSDDELIAIKETLKTAYYTPIPLVDALYQLLDHYLDSVPTQLLEPSAGHGVFLERLPASWQAAKINAVEIDSVSCQLLKALYPDANVHHTGFECFQSKPIFDLIVGNPPYGQIKVDDQAHQDISAFSIHHFFVAKSMRLLQKNGYLAMILPRYFLDAPQKHVRGIIEEEGGSLVEAYRLPDNLFSDAKVTTDLVLLQKKALSTHWVSAKAYCQDDKKAWLNTYFHDNSDHIFGELVFVKMYGRDDLSCRSVSNDMLIKLQQAITDKRLSLPDCRAYLNEKLDKLENDLAAIKQLHGQTQTLLEALDSQEQQMQTLCQQAMSL